MTSNPLNLIEKLPWAHFHPASSYLDPCPLCITECLCYHFCLRSMLDLQGVDWDLGGWELPDFAKSASHMGVPAKTCSFVPVVLRCSYFFTLCLMFDPTTKPQQMTNKSPHERTLWWIGESNSRWASWAGSWAVSEGGLCTYIGHNYVQMGMSP